MSRAFGMWWLSALAILPIGCGGSEGSQAQTVPPPIPAERTVMDVRYAEAPPGTDPNLLSLDLYLPEGADAAPVVVWVHGGAWVGGDKANFIADKAALFNGAGWCLASVNYRLSSTSGDLANPTPGSVMYPVHEQDVAAAVSWVKGHAAEYYCDPNRIALVGHSAGAAIVALVGTDGSFLGAHGISPAELRGVLSLDTNAYDLPLHMATAAGLMRLAYLNAYGEDPAVWAHASPVNHVASGSHPPFLLAERGEPERRAILHKFADALTAAGIPVTTADATALTHEEVDTRMGTPADTVITPPLMDFLRGGFGEE